MTKLMTAAHAATAFAAIALASPSAEAAFSVPRVASSELSMVEKTGCHGGGGGYVARRHVHIARQSVRPKVQVAARKAKPVTVAAIEPETTVPATANTAATTAETTNESSSITPNGTPDKTASLPAVAPQADAGKAATTPVTIPATAPVLPVKAAEAKPVVAEEKKVANKDLGCKAFFPAAGITLSVPCK